MHYSVNFPIEKHVFLNLRRVLHRQNDADASSLNKPLVLFHIYENHQENIAKLISKNSSKRLKPMIHGQTLRDRTMFELVCQTLFDQTF